MEDTTTLRFLLIAALASLVLSQSNTTSSTWQTSTNMADDIHKDTTVGIIEGSLSDQDVFSEYSQYNTTLSSPDVQKTVNYHTSLRGMKEVRKDDVTTNFQSDVTNRLVSPNAPSGVTEEVIISDGESTNETSTKYVATPRQLKTVDVGRMWYRDSEVRETV
ncbi:hypothetical protein BaRGS_00013035 [Batillaria attramentaria]|uniref:Uncharacterized protein n=1 Tax=Batillaria attramentaria TaxID=370345 RepID=A0ABD0L8Z3_9CAEN